MSVWLPKSREIISGDENVLSLSNRSVNSSKNDCVTLQNPTIDNVSPSCLLRVEKLSVTCWRKSKTRARWGFTVSFKQIPD